MQSLTFITFYNVQANHNVQVFATNGQLTGQPARLPYRVTLLITATYIFHVSQKQKSSVKRRAHKHMVL